MGHIKEPQGVDFIIQSKPLTDEERTAINEFISNYKTKEKLKNKTRNKKASASRKKSSV